MRRLIQLGTLALILTASRVAAQEDLPPEEPPAVEEEETETDTGTETG